MCATLAKPETALIAPLEKMRAKQLREHARLTEKYEKTKDAKHLSAASKALREANEIAERIAKLKAVARHADAIGRPGK